MAYSDVDESKLPKTFIEGQAQDIKHEYDTTESSLSFKLVNISHQENENLPDKISMEGYQIIGSMSEGDLVRVYYNELSVGYLIKNVSEKINTKYIKNLTTQRWIRSTDYYEGRVLSIVEKQENISESEWHLGHGLNPFNPTTWIIRDKKEVHATAWHLVLERRDFNDQILTPIPIQMIGKRFVGNIMVGQIVRVEKKRRKGKTIVTSKVMNMSTDTVVKAKG